MKPSNKKANSNTRESFLERLKSERDKKLEQKIQRAGISKERDHQLENLNPNPAEEIREDYFETELTSSSRNRVFIGSEKNNFTSSRKIIEEEKAFLKSASTNFNHISNTKILNKEPKYPQERFYNNAKLRHKHKALFEKMIESDIKSMANSKKITRNSEKILIKRLEENLELAFVSVDQNDEKIIGFEQLGRVMFLMDIFEIIKYDEDSNVVKEEFYTSSRQQQLRRFKEMEFHEAVFNILAYDLEKNTLVETIKTDISYAFLRLLLDPRKIKFREHLQMISQLLSPLGFYVGDEMKDCLDEKEQKIEILSLKELLKKYYKLRKSRLHHSKIGYLKPSKIEELQSKIQKEYTFNPKINETSRVLAKRQHLRKSNYSSNSKKLKKNRNSRIELMYKRERERKEKLDLMKLEKEHKELSECTFQPKLTHHARHNRRPKSSARTIVNRLYTPEFVIEKQNRLDSIKKTKEKIKEQLEMNKCTFHPKIMGQNPDKKIMNSTQRSNSLYKPNKAPLGYHKAIGRMRLANEKKLRKKRLLEHIPTGENYEKRKKEKVRVPRCARLKEKQMKRKTKPFMYLDVNVAPGKTGRVGICEDDDPEEKARNFAITFQLNENMEAGLCNLIQAYITKKLEGEIETEESEEEDSDYEEDSSEYYD